jgi:hypothetical protein
LNIIFPENREDIVDEQEMENYLISVIALQKLMQAELSLMVGIIPIKHHHQVFQIIIQESLANIVHEGEVLIMFTINHMTKQFNYCAIVLYCCYKCTNVLFSSEY